MESSNILQQFSQYWHDFNQRSILFMDVMRRRGNDMVEMTSGDTATVLTFQFEKILDGATFDQPINYWLACMLPLKGVPIDPKKRPYVIQDPRAGRGPGIAGFKKDSEIGAALKHGNPVYYIGFDVKPLNGQTYEDVIRGQVKFYEKVAELHPDSPKMCIIGNCAAGYLSMFSAMQEPELIGPVLIAGSPLSYWNGEHGRNPMRYIGGLIGGVWVINWLGDIGAGKFDGTHLVMNFNLLSFDNFIWGKQYDLFANIDAESGRFLQFERWMGAFTEFNREEIKWLIDKFFIQNLLTTGRLTTDDGIKLDPRNIESPIVTFISDGDNISPPAQAAGWIADLYQDVDEIVARNKTIVYCLNKKIGHLALFTGSKVAKRENELFVENMDTIDLLPPGLYELVLDTPEGEEGAALEGLRARFIAREIEDIKKLGYNNEEDDRAFATMAKYSQAINSFYESFVHPWFRMYQNNTLANIIKNSQWLRWNYMIFSDKFNPFMSYFADNAQQVKNERELASADNWFKILQDESAALIAKLLKNHQNFSYAMQEQTFFSLWGNGLVQQFWGTAGEVPRFTPSLSQLERAKLLKHSAATIQKHMPVKNRVAAFFRVVALLLANRHEIRARTALILVNWAKEHHPHLSDDELREIIRYQFMTVWFNEQQAFAALREFVLTKVEHTELVFGIQKVFGQIGQVSDEVLAKLHELSQNLQVQKEQ